MTECQAVQRAGVPGNVASRRRKKRERTVVLTYLSGTWPGIYHFSDGRLKESSARRCPRSRPKKPAKKNAKKPVKKNPP